MSEETRIRENWGPMPFDRDGRHATGREILVFWKPINQFIWRPEYEGDYTCLLPTTDPDYYPEES